MAVLEVGLGGRWDATSATNPVGVAVTGIGLDHMRILGNTLAEIAAEKAAVIKPGRFAVLGEGTHEPEVQQVMDERCAACGVAPVVVRHEVISLPRFMGDDLAVRCPAPRATYTVRLPKPAYQAQNVACAVDMAEEYLGRPLDEALLNASLAACPTPGRFDVLARNPLLMIDACHNPQSCDASWGRWGDRPRAQHQADAPHRRAHRQGRRRHRAVARACVPARCGDADRFAASASRLRPGNLGAGGARPGGAARHGPCCRLPCVPDALARWSVRARRSLRRGTITLAGEVAAFVAK